MKLISKVHFEMVQVTYVSFLNKVLKCFLFFLMSTTSINTWQNKANPSQTLVSMELSICEYIMSEDGEFVESIS